MKKVYSLKRLGGRELDSIPAQVGLRQVVMGVDVAKHELVLMMRCGDSQFGDAQFIGPYRAMNPGQIGQVVELARRLSLDSAATVALEPSGTYGDALRQALSDARIAVQRVQSKRSHDYAEVFDGVPSQHDGKDAAVIAELCAIGKGCPWPHEPPSETQSLMCHLVDWMDGHSRMHKLWIGRLEALLARHWPEASSCMDIGSGALLRALKHYGGPAALSRDAHALKNLVRWGGPMLNSAKAAALVESAGRTLGVRQNQADQTRIMCCAQQTLEASLEAKRANRQLRQLAGDNKTIGHQAQAIGLASACVLWCRLGDPRDYSSAGAYRKAMGLNLTQRSSGQYKGKLRISKRGDAMVRRWLHMAALRLVQQSPQVKQWYQDKRQRDGNGHKRAITAVVRRLAVALYKIAVKEEPFDSRRLFAGIAAATAAGGCKD
jgi:transposase